MGKLCLMVVVPDNQSYASEDQYVDFINNHNFGAF